MASILGYDKVALRGDTEPSMKKLLQMVVMARTRLGLTTVVEAANPDSSEHQGVRAERYIDKVRRLGLCLLHTVAANANMTIKSKSPAIPVGVQTFSFSAVALPCALGWCHFVRVGAWPKVRCKDCSFWFHRVLPNVAQAEDERDSLGEVCVLGSFNHGLLEHCVHQQGHWIRKNG